MFAVATRIIRLPPASRANVQFGFMPSPAPWAGTLYQLLACRVAVGHTRVNDGRSFEGDGPNTSLDIGFLEFFDLDKLIRRDVLEHLLRSAGWPRHFDGSDLCGLANADVLHQR